MKIFRLGVIGGLALTLAACPQDRDVAVDDPLARPGVEEPRTDVMTVPPGAAQANLEATGAIPVSGEVHAVPQQNSTEIWVTVRNAQPNQSFGARVQSGTCQSPGVEIARIDVIGTDNLGQGQSRTDVGHAPHLIMDGNHIVALYAEGTEPERDMPVACATLPEHGATQM